MPRYLEQYDYREAEAGWLAAFKSIFSAHPDIAEVVSNGFDIAGDFDRNGRPSGMWPTFEVAIPLGMAPEDCLLEWVRVARDAGTQAYFFDAEIAPRRDHIILYIHEGYLKGKA